MPEILTTELKSDLEYIYKKAGDLLTDMQADNNTDDGEMRALLERVEFTLEDICGTLQKDIYNCDYLITKFRTVKIHEMDEMTQKEH